MINLTDLNKRIAPYTASAYLTEMTDLDFFGFVVTVTAPDGRKMASATDEQRMIESVVLSLIEMLEAQMNTKEFEDNLMKANDVVLFSEDGFTVAYYTGNQVLHNIYRMAGEIHEKLVVRDTPMLVTDKDGKERCPVCGCKVKKAFCPKCGQRLIYQEVEDEVCSNKDVRPYKRKAVCRSVQADGDICQSEGRRGNGSPLGD